jgi:hypothetical protein
MRAAAPARGSIAKCTPLARVPLRVCAVSQDSSNTAIHTGRRATLLEMTAAAAAAAAAALPLRAVPAFAAQQPQAPQVGTYLPAAEGLDGLVRFVPDPKKTPALRAGMVNAAEPYSFALPPSFREARVANIASGNYVRMRTLRCSTAHRCMRRHVLARDEHLLSDVDAHFLQQQENAMHYPAHPHNALPAQCAPRCDEPWTEVIFESASDGRITLIVSPLVKLTRTKGARIEDIGPPEGLLTSLGSYITGTFLDDEDVVGMAAKRQVRHDRHQGRWHQQLD